MGEAGLDVPRIRMEWLADGRHGMLIARFDRMPLPGARGRRHMVSALTMLALREQDSSAVSYAAMADALGQRSVVALSQAIVVSSMRTWSSIFW